MKKFKIIDTWISFGLIILFTLLSLIKLDYTFLIGYCTVGGWQMISMIIHAINGWFTHHKAGRYYYHLSVTVLAAITLLGLLVYPVLWVVMIALLFAAPFMAIYYTWLCYDEVYVKMQRPLAVLK
jgi:hypothetical protein